MIKLRSVGVIWRNKKGQKGCLLKKIFYYIFAVFLLHFCCISTAYTISSVILVQFDWTFVKRCALYLCSNNAAKMQQFTFFLMSIPSVLFCKAKIPLITPSDQSLIHLDGNYRRYSVYCTYAAKMQQNKFFAMSIPSDLFCHVKIPLITPTDQSSIKLSSNYRRYSACCTYAVKMQQKCKFFLQ